MDSPMKFELVSTASDNIFDLLGIPENRAKKIYDQVISLLNVEIKDTSVIVNHTYLHAKVSQVAQTPQELVLALHYVQNFLDIHSIELKRGKKPLQPLKVVDDSPSKTLSQSLGIPLERLQVLMFAIKCIFQTIAVTGREVSLIQEIQRLRDSCKTEEEYTFALSVFISNVYRLLGDKFFKT